MGIFDYLFTPFFDMGAQVGRNAVSHPSYTPPPTSPIFGGARAPVTQPERKRVKPLDVVPGGRSVVSAVASANAWRQNLPSAIERSTRSPSDAFSTPGTALIYLARQRLAAQRSARKPLALQRKQGAGRKKTGYATKKRCGHQKRR